jgi:predicted dehydrogenase
MKVLIVGLGSIAQKHIKALKKILPNVEIYALRSSINANCYDDIKNVFDLTELDSLNVDFAIVSNPTAFHKETILKLIPYKIPLFIEKPVFSDLEIEPLLNEVKINKLITYVACNLRFLDSIRFVKDYIVNKRVNEVNIYCGSYLPDWRPGVDFRKVYSANKDMGGGVHLDLIHEIDYMFWLFGAPLNVVSTITNTSTLEITAFDYANYLFGYPDFHVSTILNYYRKDTKRCLEILLDEGTLAVNLLTNRVTFKGTEIFSSNKTIANTYEDQLRFFIEEVLEKGVGFNTIYEAVEILKLCIPKG